MEPVSPVSNVVWTGHGQCDAVINGERWSGITGRSRFWPSVMLATDGVVPEWQEPPYTPGPTFLSVEDRLAALEGRMSNVEAEVETVKGERQEPVGDTGIGGGDIGIGGGGKGGGDEEPINPAFAPITPAIGGMGLMGGMATAPVSEPEPEPGADAPAVKTFRVTSSKIHTNKCRYGTGGGTVDRDAAIAMIEAGTHVRCVICNPKVIL